MLNVQYLKIMKFGAPYLWGGYYINKKVYRPNNTPLKYNLKGKDSIYKSSKSSGKSSIL